MKNKLCVCAAVFLAILWFNPSCAAAENPEAKALATSLLPTEDDYLPFIKDETEKEKLKAAIEGPDKIRKVDAFWARDNKSYLLIYGLELPGDKVFVSALTFSKDDQEFKKRSLQLSEEFMNRAAQNNLKLVKIDSGKNSLPSSQYYFVEDAKGMLIGNVFLISQNRNFLAVSFGGAFVFEDAETIEKFLSGKIEKALSFTPDEKSPGSLSN